MKKGDGPGGEKRGTVLDSYFKDRPLFYKISLHTSVDGSAKNVIFCRTKNAWKRSKIGSFVDYYNFICYPKYSIYIK